MPPTNQGRFFTTLASGVCERAGYREVQAKRAETEAIKREGQIVCTGTRAGKKAEGATGAQGRTISRRGVVGKGGMSRLAGFEVNTCVRGRL